MTSFKGLPDDRFSRAEELERSDRFAEALDIWRTLASKDPDASVLCRQAALAEQLGHTEEAEQAFRRAISVDNKLAWPYVGLASMLMDRGAYSDAEQLLRTAIGLEKNAITYTILGAALRAQGDENEATKNLEAAILLDPTYEEAYFNLALIKRKGDPSEAERLFEKALEFDPAYTAAHRELGWLLNEHQPGPRAGYHLWRAVELNPDDAWSRIYLGNLLWRLGDEHGALLQFQKAMELEPDSAFPMWSAANVYENQEMWSNAEALYERAIQVEPDDAVAHMNFGRMLVKRGELARGLSHLKRALEIDPGYQAARDLASGPPFNLTSI